MKFYFTDYYELEEKEINEILNGLRDGIEFEALFGDFVNLDMPGYLIYDQVKAYIETLLTPAEIQKMKADGLLD